MRLRVLFPNVVTVCELGGITSVRSCSFPAVCDLSRPREVSEWPRPSFPKTVTNIAQHLAFAHRVSSCLSLRVRVLGAAAVGLSSV